MVRLIRGSLTLLACMLVASLGYVKPPPMSSLTRPFLFLRSRRSQAPGRAWSGKKAGNIGNRSRFERTARTKRIVAWTIKASS